ncbi:MAG: hypothetical protein DRI57_12570 [Deltaproteobacteria bacterium]|nr:MAG: hypothetical protein DRI57_12570 [Deltaproteobacteria bacterium]
MLKQCVLHNLKCSVNNKVADYNGFGGAFDFWLDNKIRPYYSLTCQSAVMVGSVALHPPCIGKLKYSHIRIVSLCPADFFANILRIR